MLPKFGTRLEELKCKKCKSPHKSKKLKDCQDPDCWHKEKKIKDKDKEKP